MKTKLIVLLFLLAGCSDEEQYLHYSDVEMKYRILAGHADFIIKEQQNVLLHNHVTVPDTAPPATRQATQTDSLTAVKLSTEMENLKTLLDEAVTHCKDLQKICKKKYILQSQNRRLDIDLYTKMLRKTEENMLKVTGGIAPEQFMEPYLPKNLKKQSGEFK